MPEQQFTSFKSPKNPERPTWKFKQLNSPKDFQIDSTSKPPVLTNSKIKTFVYVDQVIPTI